MVIGLVWPNFNLTQLLFLARVPIDNLRGCTAASAVMEEFNCDLTYMTDESRQDIEPAVAIQLVEQFRDPVSGLVCLIFHVVFAPFKAMKYVTIDRAFEFYKFWTFSKYTNFYTNFLKCHRILKIGLKLAVMSYKNKLSWLANILTYKLN